MKFYTKFAEISNGYLNNQRSFINDQHASVRLSATVSPRNVQRLSGRYVIYINPVSQICIEILGCRMGRGVVKVVGRSEVGEIPRCLFCL